VIAGLLADVTEARGQLADARTALLHRTGERDSARADAARFGGTLAAIRDHDSLGFSVGKARSMAAETVRAALEGGPR
jgi:hypothetical protein